MAVEFTPTHKYTGLDKYFMKRFQKSSSVIREERQKKHSGGVSKPQIVIVHLDKVCHGKPIMAKLKYFKFVKSNTECLFAFDLVSIISEITRFCKQETSEGIKFVFGRFEWCEKCRIEAAHIHLSWNASLAAVPAALDLTLLWLPW